MHNYWFIGDTHFGHTKTWSEFKRADGSPLRNFSSTEEMDQHMIDCWNNVVGDHDVVWHLGDVIINRKYMSLLHALKGKKRLIRGNHDIFATKEYMVHFEEIYGVTKCRDYILSHVPLHPESFNGRSWKRNVHGHLHANMVMKTDEYGKRVRDPLYINVSVEQVNYTPVAYDDLETLHDEFRN